MQSLLHEKMGVADSKLAHMHEELHNPIGHAMRRRGEVAHGLFLVSSPPAIPRTSGDLDRKSCLVR